uniref:Arylesterase n=1 Tax=Caenorhabditis japonica TaxID=281687 RepID=A0A8R1I8B0_CAEJA
MLLKIVGLALLAIMVQFGFKTLLMFDVNKRIYNHRPGVCRKIEGPVHGSEDIIIVEAKQIAFASSGIVWLPRPETPITWKGEIFLYDLKTRTYKAESLPIRNLEDVDGFHPHGMSYWTLPDGRVRLFVVVHSKSFHHSIVLLDFDEKRRELVHVRTIRDEKFVRPNDVVATGEESFLVSNDGGAQTVNANAFEAISGLYKGGLVYYDGELSHHLLGDTVANGIILSRDQKTLFVSHINKETIGIYEWDQANIATRRISEIHTLTGCDNFYVDESDHLWSGCHPVLKDAIGHLSNPSDLSLVAPSQVLRFTFSKDFQTAELVELLADDGRLISASTVGCPFDGGKQILIGTVARDLIHCDVSVPLDFY